VETLESSKHSPVLWGLDEPEPVLYGISMDREWQHSRLYEKEPRGQ